MTKIVYNACYGGFGLSDEALELYLTRKGIEFSISISDHSSSLVAGYCVNNKYFSYSTIDRADPTLVEVVEELGERANSRFSKLEIAEVPEGTRYRIDEYDGCESVMTIDDYDWKIA